MISTLKFQVVGLQYHNLNDGQVAELQRGAALRLERDRHNQHDYHAVAVYLGNRRIGFIARKQARIIAPALELGLSTVSITIDEPGAITGATTAFPVTIEIRATEPTLAPAPRVTETTVAGIYRLHLVHTNKGYIGQSGNVNDRVATHWRELSLGIHSNYLLQEYWVAHGPAGITAELVEAVPPGHTPFHQQMWLGRREKYWIAQERAAGRCINLQDGDFVLTPAAIAERDSLMAGADQLKPVATRSRSKSFLEQLEEALDARHRDMVRPGIEDREQAIAQELRAIALLSPDLDRERQQLETQAKELENQLRVPTGLRSIFQRRLNQGEIEAMQSYLAKVIQALDVARRRCDERDARRGALQRELKGLKSRRQV